MKVDFPVPDSPTTIMLSGVCPGVRMMSAISPGTLLMQSKIKRGVNQDGSPYLVIQTEIKKIDQTIRRLEMQGG